MPVAPAVPGVGPNPGGFFTAGNPAGGVPATIVDAPWLNMLQAEFEAVLVAAGITPDKTNNAQLLAAILALIAKSATASPTSPGYIKLFGLVIQWGGGEANPTQAITFPVEFPTAAFAVFVSTNSMGTYNSDTVQSSGLSQTGFTCVGGSAETDASVAGGVSFYWFAIGH